MTCNDTAVTVPTLQQMKRDGRKIVAVVAWDFQIAQIADRAGVEIVSVGDSVGINLWGHASPNDVTIDEMIVVCKAVRRGVKRAIVSCDCPVAASQSGMAVDAAARLVEESGADMVKLDGAAALLDDVRAIVRAGIPLFAQMEFTAGAEASPDTTARLVADAQRLEDAGASLIDFKYSGPVAGAAVTSAVSIPVVGGLGGGPWLDGRLRMAHAAIGYAASNLDTPADTYANVAKIAFDAIEAYAGDVRAGRQIKGAKRT